MNIGRNRYSIAGTSTSYRSSVHQVRSSQLKSVDLATAKCRARRTRILVSVKLLAGGGESRASDKGWSRRATGRQRICDSNMAAATSVVVLDRGNNTTCTINLHGVCVCVCVYMVCVRIWCACMCACVYGVCGCVRACVYVYMSALRESVAREIAKKHDRELATRWLKAPKRFRASRVYASIALPLPRPDARPTKPYVRTYVRMCLRVCFVRVSLRSRGLFLDAI